MALKPQPQNDPSVPKAEQPQNLKNIIHDINNSLMLIGIAADELERHACANQSMNQMSKQSVAHHKSISSGNASQIVRRHIKQIGVMLQEAAHHAPVLDGNPSQSLEMLSYKTLASFCESQRLEWSLIAPPETNITVTMASFDGVVLASRAYMTRIFQNLVRNACEAYHMAADKRDVLRLSLIVHPHQQGLAITLEDNGPGIDAAVAAHIFTPHFTTKPQSGLPKGLGLSNASELAQAMGGSLRLKETSAHGSAFVLNLHHILSSRRKPPEFHQEICFCSYFFERFDNRKEQKVNKSLRSCFFYETK